MNEDVADPRAIFGPAAERYACSEIHGSKIALARLVEAVSPKGGTVLDIATGSGHTAFAFAPHVERVIATDITDAMLEVCRREAARGGLSNVHVSTARDSALPFKDESFDGVTCRLAPHHFPSPERFLAEVYRVLRSGGWFLLVDTVGPQSESASEALDALERMRDPSHRADLSSERWRKLLELARFKIRRCDESSKTLHAMDWLERTGVEESKRQPILEAIENSQGELRDYLRPRVVDSCLYFELREGIFVSDK